MKDLQLFTVVKLNIEKLFKIFKHLVYLAGKKKIKNIEKNRHTQSAVMPCSISTAVEP